MVEGVVTKHERVAMSEIAPWRERLATASLILVILNPIYWFVGVNLAVRFHAPDNTWGNLIVVGVFVGIASLVCGMFGKGSQRRRLIFAASIETFLWWFMAVGL